MSYPQTEIFNRTELLFGEERMKNLKDKKIIIFGIGGVGSWTAEALVRTGIINLTIVDADKVAVSNINRQVPATTETVGKIKTDAMRQHLFSINPEANITAINSIYSAATQHLFHLEEYDYIVDAIDSLSDKALLIYNATRARKPKKRILSCAQIQMRLLRRASSKHHGRKIPRPAPKLCTKHYSPSDDIQ